MRISPASLFACLALLALTGGPVSAQNEVLFSGFAANSKEPIQVDADSLEVSEEATGRVSVFRGNVTVNRGDTTMKAAAITIYSPSGDGAEAKASFDRIEASGKVYIRSADQVATGDSARFDSKSQTAILTGNVVLTQGNNVITGDRLTIDLKNGKARLDQRPGGRIRGIFAPGDPAPGRKG